jgi:hypothetical protein
MQRSQKKLEDGQNQVLRNQTSMRDAHMKLKSDTADIKDGQGHIRQTTDTLLDCVTTILDLSEATKQALDGALEANTRKMLSEFIEKNPLAAHEILETRQNVRFLGVDKYLDLMILFISGLNFQRTSNPSMGQ